jgi:hypothetical protein
MKISFGILLLLCTLSAFAQMPKPGEYLRKDDPHGRYAGYFYVYGDVLFPDREGQVLMLMDEKDQNPLAYDFGAFHDSLAYFKVEPKSHSKQYLYGYMDEKFNIVIQPAFKSVTNFYNGLAWVSDGKKSFYIDKTGMVVDNVPPGKFVDVKDKMNVGNQYVDSMASMNNHIRRIYVKVWTKDERKKADKEEERIAIEKLSKQSSERINKKTAEELKQQDAHQAQYCSACGGSGVTGGGNLQCGSCGGSGGTQCGTCGGRGRLYNQKGESVYCTSCHGEGKRTCSSCNGSGKKKIQGSRCTVCKGTGLKEG